MASSPYYDQLYEDVGTEQTNPTTSVIMANLGEVPAGLYEVLVIASASANAKFQVEQKDIKTGISYVNPKIFYIPANNPAEFRTFVRITAPGVKLRVMMNTSLTGTAAVTLQAIPLNVQSVF